VVAPPRELVTLRVDGEDVSAVEGEPVAMSLLASGRLVLGRSVKYHRPRGTACFSGRCDGCLMRVDGSPSVRTCGTAAAQGMTLETQNVVGTAELDLLSAADWFFPGGMNHHEMFTWAKPVNHVMQLVARQVVGIGTLPDAPAGVAPVEHRELDGSSSGPVPRGSWSRPRRRDPVCAFSASTRRALRAAGSASIRSSNALRSPRDFSTRRALRASRSQSSMRRAASSTSPRTVASR
jgi:hypothetical protein